MSAPATQINFDHLLAPVTGMTCSACAARLEKALLRAPGVQSATVNFATEQADVTFDADNMDAAAVAGVIAKAGYGVGETTFIFDVGGMTCSTPGTRSNDFSTRPAQALQVMPPTSNVNSVSPTP